MKEFLIRNKIARVIVLLAKELNISSQRAISVYYNSKTSRLMRQPQSGIYLMSDAYIVDNIIFEFNQPIASN